ncbi:MAG: hypothetical protein K9W46_02470 [Candidatus Heimdallarchaeum endolithica]|uniref:MalT-like TPR region domain-containing protein n=1 Tax=Candidatus Heimdallarchaeum endolithica TaxID=2876572 RepID=A0A9Y1FPK2_9ARCH|nr:MAG: hypothetical protein K9W46_02470 [Candidatus Heimdallarchaeum endolithica]
MTLQNSDFDIPEEFSSYSQFLIENKKIILPKIKEWMKKGKTFFQSLVYACDEIGSELPTPDVLKPTFLEIAIIGYFLLDEYEKVLKIETISDNFLSNYFKYKSAWLLGHKKAQSFLADLVPSLMELKKQNKEIYEICNNIISLEVSFISSNKENILKHAAQFKQDLFDKSLISTFPLLAVEIAGDLAYREYRTGDPAFAGWLEIYKELVEAFNMDSRRLDCYTILGGLYRYKGYLEDADEYYNRAMELSEKIGNEKAYVEIIARIADFEHTRGNFDVALKLCLDVIQKTEEKGIINKSIYINLGEILIKQQKYEEAVKYLKKLENDESQETAIINILHGYALTKLDEKELYNSGIKLLEKGGALSEKTGNRRFLTIYYYYRGRAHLDSYDLSSAIKNFEMCYNTAINTEFQYVLLSQIYLAVAYLHRFKVSQQDADLTQSKHYVANVITICKEQNLPILANILLLQGQILMILEEYIDAKHILEQSMFEAEKAELCWTKEKAEQYLELLYSEERIKNQILINEITELIDNIAKFSFTKNIEQLPNFYFLMLTYKGKELITKSFDKEFEEKIHLIRDLIHAVSNFNEYEGIRSINFEGITLIIEKISNTTAILACDSDSFNARIKIIEILKNLQKYLQSIVTEEDEIFITILKDKAKRIIENTFES